MSRTPQVPTTPNSPLYRYVPIIAMALFFSVWEFLCYSFSLPLFLLPAPHDILTRLFYELHGPTLWQHIWATVSVACMGLVIALCMGIFAGWASFHFPMLHAATRWLITSTQAVPVIAIAPLLFLWVNDEYWSRVFVTVVITFFPLFSTTYTALQRIPRELREVASLEGYSQYTAWQSYEAPLAAPVIFAGIRTSMVLATTGAVVGEYLGGRYGLGALINVARGMFDTTLVFVAVVLLIGITLGFSALFQRIETFVLQRVE
ncbi:MAG: hypothetical protein RLY87_2566 [Chloroflexota bacterium]|jgi:NitT/TauT family transport system permease protein